MVDVAIAGGGIAGSTLAILLGRQGFSVELFERGEFPREKACGEGLMPAGVAVLARLGLTATVGGIPFYGVRYHFGSVVAEGRFLAMPDLPAAGCGQRRKHLDQVLFQTAAATPGVKTYTGARVDAPLVENGRVVGLIVEGEPRRASLVVAADGPHSPVRHHLGLNIPARRKRFGIRAHFRLAPGQTQPAWVDVFAGRGHELYVTPLPNHEVLVAALTHVSALGESPERAFHCWRLAQPQLASRLEGAEQVSAFMGASPLAGRARAGVAPGVVLLGDAAGFTDPITGGGMAQALNTAELLARHISCNFDAIGRGNEDWLWRFERERRAMLKGYQILTQIMLWLAGHRCFARGAVSTLQFSPALFSHLIAVCEGLRPRLPAT